MPPLYSEITTDLHLRRGRILRIASFTIHLFEYQKDVPARPPPPPPPPCRKKQNKTEVENLNGFPSRSIQNTHFCG